MKNNNMKYYEAQLYYEDYIEHSSSGTMDHPADCCWDLDSEGLLDAIAGCALFSTREDAERAGEASVRAFDNDAYYKVVEMTEEEARDEYEF